MDNYPSESTTTTVSTTETPKETQESPSKIPKIIIIVFSILIGFFVLAFSIITLMPIFIEDRPLN